MTLKLLFTNQANHKLNVLEKNPSQKKQFKAVKKALAYLEKIRATQACILISFFQERPDCEEISEAYAENNTPGTYRIFWYYGLDKRHFTIIEIYQHP